MILLVAQGVTLVVALGIFSQKFGRWQGPIILYIINGTLSVYECSLSHRNIQKCGDIQTLPAVIKFV